MAENGQGTSTPLPTARHATWLGLGLLVAIAGISSLHYVTAPARVVFHEVYNYLCYVPIVVAAYRFGMLGGIAAAALTSALFIPHIRATWATNAPYTASQYAQVVVFHLLGLGVGWLAGSQQRLTARYRDAATSLERANREIRESREHLRRADRLSALGEIAAGLAHEIQNPLAGIKGALDIVASRAQPKTPEAEFADIGRKELGRLETLVREFLDYARPREPTLRPTAVPDLVERVTALLRPEAEKKGVRLVLEYPDASSDLSLNLDADQMTQVILNVVLNAIQASPADGLVRIRVSTDPGSSTIEVIDQGNGIPPEHASRIFDPFFTTKSRGTGLGLATSHRIVAAHRGTITAVPGSPTGTIFRIHLPRTTS